jgi:hypothetical protein
VPRQAWSPVPALYRFGGVIEREWRGDSSSGHWGALGIVTRKRTLHICLPISLLNPNGLQSSARLADERLSPMDGSLKSRLHEPHTGIDAYRVAKSICTRAHQLIARSAFPWKLRE